MMPPVGGLMVQSHMNPPQTEIHTGGTPQGGQTESALSEGGSPANGAGGDARLTEPEQMDASDLGGSSAAGADGHDETTAGIMETALMMTEDCGDEGACAPGFLCVDESCREDQCSGCAPEACMDGCC